MACVLLGATGTALYGASAPYSPPSQPMQSATPGTVCTTGQRGAYADHAYECVDGYWRPLK